MVTQYKSESGRVITVGEVHSFVVERSPGGSATKSGKLTAGTILRIRGDRITLRDGSGFEYTTRASSVRG